MSTGIIKRVQDAVRRGVQARSRFYASIDLADEQYLGAPASPQEIAMLEQFFGKSLPPSYRAFLALHDGWRMIDGGCDLLRICEMTSGPIVEKVRKWQAAMAKEGQTALAAGLVIGFSPISQKRIVMDFGQVDAEGESRIIQWDADELSEYDSFIKWLEDSAQEFEDLVESPEDYWSRE